MKAEGYTFIKGLRIYARHGVMPQEREVGACFTVDLRIGYDMSAAMHNDDISCAIDYSAVYKLVEREMSKNSNLLETIAGRLARAIFRDFPLAATVDLKIVKDNPPMGADCDGAGVEIHIRKDI